VSCNPIISAGVAFNPRQNETLSEAYDRAMEAHRRYTPSRNPEAKRLGHRFVGDYERLETLNPDGRTLPFIPDGI
jgi:hypothetical protein